MLLKTEKIALQPILDLAANVPVKQTLMPILQNILIEITEKGARIYATDLSLSFIGMIPSLKSDVPAKMLLNAKIFKDAVKSLEDGDITLDTPAEDGIIQLSQKSCLFSFAVQEVEEFPEINPIESETVFTVQPDLLFPAIESVSYAIARKEDRWILTGLYLKTEKDQIILCATDGNRLALKKIDFQGLFPTPAVVIPRHTVEVIETVFAKSPDIEISLSSDRVQFSSGKITVISRVIEGIYPDFENIIPDHPNACTINLDEFKKALNRVTTIKDPVEITFDERVTMKMKSDEVMITDAVDAVHQGTPATLFLNAKFLLDLISHVKNDRVTFHFPVTFGAVMVKDGNTIHIIMPIRV